MILRLVKASVSSRTTVILRSVFTDSSCRSASAIIFKAIIDIEKTKAWFGQIAGVLSPFIFGALLAYILNPMVRVFYHGMELLSKKFKFRLNKAVHKILAILITYVIVLGFAVLILVYILPEVMNNIVDFVNFIPGAVTVRC